MGDAAKTLYDRLGGHAAITAVVNNLLPRLQEDMSLGRFWAHRGTDGVAREKQLLIDYLCSCSGGPTYYTGRLMRLSHAGMRISEPDWQAFLAHLNATLDGFQVPKQDRGEVLAFIDSIKAEVVEL
jgi:hemoglobin